MINTLRGLVIVLLACAAPAFADPVLDFAGPPVNFFEQPSSVFTGDWDSKTGTMTVDDAIVMSLIYEDGSSQNYFAKLLNVSGHDDAALGADVDISATFVNGAIDGTASNSIKVYDGSTVFYEASIYAGSIGDGAIDVAFVSVLNSRFATTVDDSVSAWFSENYTGLARSGAMVFNFDGIRSGAAGQGANGITNLTNLNGKLIATPEPGTLALFGAAAIGFAWIRRRKRA